jgi:hypothetical protein
MSGLGVSKKLLKRHGRQLGICLQRSVDLLFGGAEFGADVTE